MAAYEYWRVRVQFTAGVWTDVTADVDTMAAPIRATTGATAETTGEPASLSLVLHNPGFKYTPGSGSPTALATGQPIQYYEIIADQVVYLFTGFVEFPEIDSVNLSMTQTQGIAVSAIDQLSAWERSPTFVSTLAAHIRSNPTATLSRYWPPTGRQPFQDMVAAYQLAVVHDSTGSPQTATFTAEDQPVAVADDLLVPGFVPGASDGFRLLAFPALDFLAGQALTIVAWIQPTSAIGVNIDIFNATIVENAGSSALVLFHSSGQLTANINFGGLTGTINSGIAMPVDVGLPVALHYGYSPSVFELWIGRNQLVGSLSGTPPTSSYVAQIYVGGGQYAGRIGHIQMHVGNAFTFADFQAQHVMGLTGLERQATGDRIRTIAGYAGLDGGALINVDTGCSIMQTARLAGQTIAAAMYEARDTERGDLFVDGGGLLTFHDRRSIYNI